MFENGYSDGFQSSLVQFQPSLVSFQSLLVSFKFLFNPDYSSQGSLQTKAPAIVPHQARFIQIQQLEVVFFKVFWAERLKD